MSRRSTIEQLAPEHRERIGRLRDAGSTIDAILDELVGDGVLHISRSALGRHVKRLDEVADRMRQSRQVAEALVSRLGAAGDESRLLRLNAELLHGQILDLQMAAEDGEEMTMDARQVQFLARALKDISAATKADADTVLRVRRDAEDKTRAAAAAAVDAEVASGRARGLTAETVEAIKARILGVGSQEPA